MREVDQSLDNMKNQHKQRMDTCEERRIQFEAKQAKMREQVLRFEKFIQENDAKRQRAESKAKQERKIYEDKLKEIHALTDKIKNLELEQNQLMNLLGKNWMDWADLTYSVVLIVRHLLHYNSQKWLLQGVSGENSGGKWARIWLVHLNRLFHLVYAVA